MMSLPFRSALILLFCLAWSADAEEMDKASSLPGFVHHPAIRMSVFAQEPLVVSPASLTFNALGDCYVVEMRDYPYGFGPSRQPGGTVRLLRDINKDGVADEAHLFANELSFPTSITTWRKGVLVLAPPQIIYLEDSDGDHRADVRQTLIEGINLGVTDSNANGLRWDGDGWLHVINGGNGGRIRFADSQHWVELGDADFAIHPDSRRIRRTYSTGGGFGLVMDGFGHSFTTHNTNYIQQRILPLPQVENNPAVPPRPTTQNISELGNAPRIYPISTASTRVNHPEQAGHFSSAGGMGLLLNQGDPRWPASLKNSVFICDVVSNLVHRAQLYEDGPLYRAYRAEEEKTSEFLASTDPAFRPVGLELGPDGALYLLDFHRTVIEHPDYIPAKVLEKLDIRAGEDQGRIYRITPNPEWKENESTAEESDIKTGKLMLAHQAVAELERLAKARPPFRCLTFRELETALEHSNPLVREVGLHLAVRKPGVLPEAPLLALQDEHPRVCFYAALALDGRRMPKLEPLLKMLLRDAKWEWSRYAVFLAIDDEAPALLTALLTSEEKLATLSPDLQEAVIRDAAEVAAASLRPAEAEHFIDALTPMLSPAAAASSSGRESADPRDDELALLTSQKTLRLRAMLAGLHRGWQRSWETRPNPELSARLVNALDEQSTLASAPETLDLTLLLGIPLGERWRQLLDEAAASALDTSVSIEKRIHSLELLSRGKDPRLLPEGMEILRRPEMEALQLAALRALAGTKAPELGALLVEAWPHMAPSLRAPTIQLWLGNTHYHDAMVSGMEKGLLQVNELNLDLEQRRTLLRHAQADIQRRAAAFLGDEEYGNRKALVLEWLAKLPEQGDAVAGREVFVRKCIDCHKVGEQGHAVGPPLASQSHRSVEDLLSHILDPNMAINPNYVTCVVETHDGELLTGLLSAETPGAVALLLPKGEIKTVPRSNIASRRTLSTSLMPEGLEKDLAPADIRSLITFLQTQ